MAATGAAVVEQGAVAATGQMAVEEPVPAAGLAAVEQGAVAVVE